MHFETQVESLDYKAGIAELSKALDAKRGMYLSSGVEYPGRYTRWDFAFIDPPLELIARNRTITVRALSERGVFWLKHLTPMLAADSHVALVSQTDRLLELTVSESDQFFPEEERSKQPSVVTPLRTVISALTEVFDDPLFGFYGAFGYELIFQFDPPPLVQDHTDVKLFHLYFADELHLVDRRREVAEKTSLHLLIDGDSSDQYSNEPFEPIEIKTQKDSSVTTEVFSAPSDTEYETMVLDAKEEMRLGNIFELVLSKRYETEQKHPLSDVFERMKSQNPSPYELFCRFDDEALVGTSPEMFVRVVGQRVESCPISGTIRRGKNAIEDAKQIQTLLNSEKDAVELSMCTDVDRNDKSRICEAGSVRVLSRRSIETYSSLFHTVDHVEGQLKESYSGLDAFLSHMWAVTLTGAPKKKAITLIEAMEGASRHWYGGAVGRLSFNGDVNTCITIRTIHFKADKAFYRVGATLVWDSDPKAEVQETITKAAPFYLGLGLKKREESIVFNPGQIAVGKTAVMIDNEDSFVHTLGEYFRRLGMTLKTFRAGVSVEAVLAEKPDLIIHSPGPGRPQEFNMPRLIQQFADAGIPQFGVCLGLQGMVEAYGGELKYLDEPRQGKQWQLSHSGEGMMAGLADKVSVAAYHSIVAHRDYFPEVLEVLAENEQGDVMAIRHKSLPLMAVQFHPESILSFADDAGLKMIVNVVKQLVLN